MKHQSIVAGATAWLRRRRSIVALERRLLRRHRRFAAVCQCSDSPEEGQPEQGSGISATIATNRKHQSKRNYLWRNLQKYAVRVGIRMAFLTVKHEENTAKTLEISQIADYDSQKTGVSLTRRKDDKNAG